MLRLLSIRNFAVIESVDAEFGAGFTVLTGETGAGKSILLDALSLLLGDRFEARQLRPGAERAEIAAEFDLDDAPRARAMLVEHDMGDADSLLLRRVLDAQGRSRAWINGSPATLTQLQAVGECLIDVHGQHAHQSLGQPQTQRALLDAFGGFSTLSEEVALAWRAWRNAIEAHESTARDASAREAERDTLAARHAELAKLAASSEEWNALSSAQTRLAHAASLLEAAAQGESELSEGDASLASRLNSLARRLRQSVEHDSALGPIVSLVDDARIGIDEAARSLRHYRERLELDPGELARVEARLAAIHDVARKYRVRPEALPQLADETARDLAAIEAGGDVARLAEAAAKAGALYDELSRALSAKRKFAAAELGHRVTAMMANLAMAGSDPIAIYQIEGKLPPLIGEQALTPITFADGAGNGLRLDAMAVQPDGQIRLRWTVLGSATTSAGVPWYHIVPAARSANGSASALSATDCQPTRWHAGETVFTWVSGKGTASVQTLLLRVSSSVRTDNYTLRSVGPLRVLTGQTDSTPLKVLRPSSGTVGADGSVAISLSATP